MIRVPSKIDTDLYSKDSINTKTKYGLPRYIKYCKNCVISNQRPNSAVEYENHPEVKKTTINFNHNEICDACLFAEKKNKIINWEEKEKELIDLCNRFRRKDGRYDCILPGSGGKDSFYASHILKTKYNMNPLTVTWAPHIYTTWGRKNFDAWIHAGFDNYLMTPNGKIHRLLTRLATELMYHPFQPFMLGQKFLAPKMALLFDIPLVFFGENEAEYGNPIQDTQKSTRDDKYFSLSHNREYFISGVSSTRLIEEFGLSKNDLMPYMPADQNLIREKKIEVHYLGYYLKWHPQSAYYYAVENGGFEASPERTPGTYSKYNSIDDKIDDLHYFTTGIKYGLGRASYDAAQEIRSGDINREEGIALVKKFDNEFPDRFIEELFQYLSLESKDFSFCKHMFEKPKMDREYFDILTDNFRSPHLWYLENGKWYLRKPIWAS